MLALECENVRDIQRVLFDFKCEGVRSTDFKRNYLSRSGGLSLSMVSIDSSGKPATGDWFSNDPDVSSPPNR